MIVDLVVLFVLIAGGAVALALARVSIDVFALSLVVFMVVFGILTPAEAFSGFSNEFIFILCAVFVLSGVVVRAGVDSGIDIRGR